MKIINRKKNKVWIKSNKDGFTLVELLVSISIFVVVMTIVMGSILSVLSINGKSQTQKTAMDNLSFALESLSRTAKFSTKYHCGNTGVLTDPVNCPSGNSSLSLQTPDGSLITYSLSGGKLTQAVNGATPQDLTSPEVVIQDLKFYVFGSYPFNGNCSSQPSNDCLQPKIIVSVSGYAGTANKVKTQTAFQMQTMISQRKLDI